jgi:hypothetical protein
LWDHLDHDPLTLRILRVAGHGNMKVVVVPVGESAFY